MTTCTYHCSPCGRHFHSLEAFDLHHDHDETGWPICLDPLDLLDRRGREQLVALTDQGKCRLRGNQDDITIWTMPRNLKRAPQIKQRAGAPAQATQRPAAA
jgi:hypothetical protein